MKVEITVVMTEILNGKVSSELLNQIRTEMIKEFGQLYTLPVKGSWIDNGKLYEDTNEIWTFFTEKNCRVRIEYYAKRIKAVTQQLAQLYTIDDNPIFI